MMHRLATALGCSVICHLLAAAGIAAEPPAIRAKVSPTTPARFACVTEGRFLLRFELQSTPKGALQAGDVARLTFRELYEGWTTTVECPLKRIKDGVAAVDVTAADLLLPPSSYHVRVDAVRKGTVLNPGASGSCEVYVAREDESPSHVLGSYFLGRIAYVWDEKLKLYYRNLPEKLPPTYDPFDPNQRAGYEKTISPDLNRHPQLQHDGGTGFLLSASVYRRCGEMPRARYCEQVVKRTLDTLLNLMLTPDGRLHGMAWKNGTFDTLYHIRQEDGFALKLISQAVLYFRDTAGEPDYARELFKRAEPIVRYQFSQPNPIGCGGLGCKVYDGRILAGLAYCCLTERALGGTFDESHLNTTLDFAKRASQHVVANQGWYDAGCLAEGKCHIGYGNQNILSGLLAARRAALQAGKKEDAAAIEAGIKSAFDFLARTNGSITGTIQWTPGRHSGWSVGHMREVLDEYRGQFGDGEVVRWYTAGIWKPTYDYWVLTFHRCNVAVAMLYACEEYQRALSR